MTWARLDDGFDEHPKIDGLSDGAFRLHVTAIVASARNLTDGHVVATKVRRLTPNYEPEHLAELLDAGLWERHGDDYVVHDFLDYNPSREQVIADRERRSSAGKKAADARWHANRNANRTNGRNAGSDATGMTDDDPDDGQTAGQSLADANGNANRMRNASGFALEVPMHPSRPDPTHVPLSSSTGLEVGRPQPVDNDGDDIAAAALAEARRQADAFDDITDPDAWARARARKMLAAGWTPPPPVPAAVPILDYTRIDPNPYCSNCDGTGLVNDEPCDCTWAKPAAKDTEPNPTANVAGLAEARQARTKPRTA